MIYTNDYFFNGKIRVSQPRESYRFSVDAPLLARWAQPKKQARILDIGCGCGVVALILAYLYSDMRVWGVELQPELAEAARRNVIANALPNLTIEEGNVCELHPDILGAPLDIIVCNPPYFKVKSGKINTNAIVARARHEMTLDIPTLAAVSRKLLKTRGRLNLIYPAERLGMLISELTARDLIPKRLRCIHSFQGHEACLVLLECCFMGSHGLKVLPPLYIYRAVNEYTDEVKTMFAEPGSYV